MLTAEQIIKRYDCKEDTEDARWKGTAKRVFRGHSAYDHDIHMEWLRLDREINATMHEGQIVDGGFWTFIDEWNSTPYRAVWIRPEEKATMTYCEGDIMVVIIPDDSLYNAELADAHRCYVGDDTLADDVTKRLQVTIPARDDGMVPVKNKERLEHFEEKSKRPPNDCIKGIPVPHYPPIPEGVKKLKDFPRPDEAQQIERMAGFRWIVEHGQFGSIPYIGHDGTQKYQPCDLFSAGVVCKVFDAMKPETRGIFCASVPAVMIKMAMSCT